MQFNGTSKDVLSSLTPNEVATLTRRFSVQETNTEDIDSIPPPPPSDDGNGSTGGVPALADPLD